MSIKLAEKNSITIIAGPCAIESQEQFTEVAKHIKNLGLKWIRGGAYKPRHSPHCFQGLGNEAIDILYDVSKDLGLNSITELVDQQSLQYAIDKIDAVQIGTRNMTNYSLLSYIGKQTTNTKKPVLFKRGMSAKISEYLSASDYITEAGNDNIVLCERGLRTFEDSTRFTLDISAVPVLHKQSRYPVCVDVSHAAGNWQLVPDLALASIAAGADAIMIEVHPNPKKSKCDGVQQLNLEQFDSLYKKMQKLALSLDKKLV